MESRGNQLCVLSTATLEGSPCARLLHGHSSEASVRPFFSSRWHKSIEYREEEGHLLVFAICVTIQILICFPAVNKDHCWHTILETHLSE
jgi:hypothetical protein